MINLLPNSLQEAQNKGIEFFMGENCEWKLECKESAKFIEKIVGCPVFAFANNGFGDYLFLKRKQDGDVEYVPGVSKKKLEHEHGGLKWVAIRFQNGQICPLVNPKSGKLKKVRFVGRGHTDDK
jgi:hypothetical protein